MNLKSAGRGTIPRLITLTLVVFATTTAGIVAGAVPAQAGSYHGTPCGDNGSDNYMKRSDALARGRSWVADGVTYSQSLCYVDSHGDYRTDCSGFVAMAWGIGGRGSDWATENLYLKTTPISVSQLLPGDALLRSVADPSEDHVALFVRWSDSAYTEPVMLEESGGAGRAVERTWTWGFSGYTPVRYDKILPDDPHGTVWDRTRSASGVWASHAVEIDTNPSITQVAAASLPNGTLHVFTLVPGSGTWERVRSASGTWAASAIHIDTNGSVTDIAAAGLPDGTLHFQGLIPGSGIWDKTRSTSGTWSSATHIDTNGSITRIASAALPDGTLHVQGLIPGSGTWDKTRSTSGTWSSATHIDANGSISSVSSGALPDGTLHVDTTAPGSGIWHRIRSASGVWAASSVHIDTNGDVFTTYTTGLPDGTLHVGGIPNVA